MQSESDFWDSIALHPPNHHHPTIARELVYHTYHPQGNDRSPIFFSPPSKIFEIPSLFVVRIIVMPQLPKN